MKTAMLFINYDELVYYIVNKDVSHLDGVYVIDSGGDDYEDEEDGDEDVTYADPLKATRREELTQLVYPSDPNKDTAAILCKVTKDEFAQAIRDGAPLIECGCLIP